MSFIKHNNIDKTQKYTYQLEIVVNVVGDEPFKIEGEPQDRAFTVDEINKLLQAKSVQLLDEEYIMVNSNGYLIMDDGEVMIVINEYMIQD